MWIPDQVGDDDGFAGYAAVSLGMMRGSLGMIYGSTSYPTPIGYPCERSEYVDFV
jgi:hypothetical protein